MQKEILNQKLKTSDDHISRGYSKTPLINQ